MRKEKKKQQIADSDIKLSCPRRCDACALSQWTSSRNLNSSAHDSQKNIDENYELTQASACDCLSTAHVYRVRICSLQCTYLHMHYARWIRMAMVVCGAAWYQWNEKKKIKQTNKAIVYKMFWRGKYGAVVPKPSKANTHHAYNHTQMPIECTVIRTSWN